MLGNSKKVNGKKATPSDLSQLLEDARNLVGKCTMGVPMMSGGGMYDELMIPRLQRGLEQLQEVSADLAAKSSFLAPKGVVSREHEKLIDGLNTINNETLPTLIIPIGAPSYAEDDLESFLHRSYEETMLSVIDEIQKRVSKETDELIAKAKEAAWEQTRGLVLEQRNNPVTGSDAFVGGRGEAYGQVVKKMNEARLAGSRFSPGYAFEEVSKALAMDYRMEQLADCWETVAMIGEESNEADANVFLASTTTRDLGKLYQGNGIEWKKHLIGNSRGFLEKAFVRFIDKTIALYPREAMLGGRPSIVERVRAFLTIRLKRMSLVEAGRIEMFPDAGALWPMIFFLVRGGCLNEALEFSRQMDVQLSRSQPNFIAYLKAFVDGNVTEQLTSQIRADYSQLLLTACDPYKLALFKVFGQCELSKRSIPEIITSSEDYLWLQLWLIVPASTTDYDLTNLQKTVLSYGPTHFNPKGVTPLRYFHVLLLVGLFEEAIGYLMGPGTGLDLEGLHMAITLLYHGLLKVSSTVQEWGNTLLDDGSVNYGMLVTRYAKAIGKVDPIRGLQYIFTLTLSKPYEAHARSLVQTLLLSPSDLSTLLGAPNSPSPGFLASHAGLLGLSDPGQFLRAIVVGAGEIGEREGRWEDAVMLFNWAGEQDRVLELLSKRLLCLFSAPVSPSTEELSNVIGTASAILTYYQSLHGSLDHRLVHRTQTALTMCRGALLVEESQWASALALIEDSLSSLIPIDGSPTDPLSPVTRLSDAIKCNRLDPHLLACLPDLILLTMTCLHAQFLGMRPFAAGDVGRQMGIDRVRGQARALMVFTGLLGSRISPELCAQLTRLDILMN